MFGAAPVVAALDAALVVWGCGPSVCHANLLRLTGCQPARLARLAWAAVPSLVRFAAAFRSEALVWAMSMCIMAKLPRLLSVKP